MKSIHKYEIKAPFGPSKVLMPKGAQILAYQAQGTSPCVWALVDVGEDVEVEWVEFFTTGTGHDADYVLGYDYIGTCQLTVHAQNKLDQWENLVLHLFKKP